MPTLLPLAPTGRRPYSPSPRHPYPSPNPNPPPARPPPAHDALPHHFYRMHLERAPLAHCVDPAPIAYFLFSRRRSHPRRARGLRPRSHDAGEHALPCRTSGTVRTLDWALAKMLGRQRRPACGGWCRSRCVGKGNATAQRGVPLGRGTAAAGYRTDVLDAAWPPRRPRPRRPQRRARRLRPGRHLSAPSTCAPSFALTDGVVEHGAAAVSVYVPRVHDFVLHTCRSAKSDPCSSCAPCRAACARGRRG
ncbi:hypothetical protein B0H13DRAFT_2092486 [Mycena leptocephala]|nr:hypothetical protein B0H13DRAFT_2092486 [Mycena leptocephala]